MLHDPVLPLLVSFAQTALQCFSSFSEFHRRNQTQVKQQFTRYVGAEGMCIIVFQVATAENRMGVA